MSLFYGMSYILRLKCVEIELYGCVCGCIEEFSLFNYDFRDMPNTWIFTYKCMYSVESKHISLSAHLFSSLSVLLFR